jgi:hypothetical protein
MDPGDLLRRDGSARDVPWIGDAWLSRADVCHNEPMFPVVSKVIDVIDNGLARPELVAQAHLGRLHARLGSPVVIDWQPVPLLADGELPEVAIEPPHRGPGNVVQNLERDRSWHLDRRQIKGSVWRSSMRTVAI